MKSALFSGSFSNACLEMLEVKYALFSGSFSNACLEILEFESEQFTGSMYVLKCWMWDLHFLQAHLTTCLEILEGRSALCTASFSNPCLQYWRWYFHWLDYKISFCHADFIFDVFSMFIKYRIVLLCDPFNPYVVNF